MSSECSISMLMIPNFVYFHIKTKQEVDLYLIGTPFVSYFFFARLGKSNCQKLGEINWSTWFRIMYSPRNCLCGCTELHICPMGGHNGSVI